MLAADGTGRAGVGLPAAMRQTLAAVKVVAATITARLGKEVVTVHRAQPQLLMEFHTKLRVVEAALLTAGAIVLQAAQAITAPLLRAKAGTHGAKVGPAVHPGTTTAVVGAAAVTTGATGLPVRRASALFVTPPQHSSIAAVRWQ